MCIGLSVLGLGISWKFVHNRVANVGKGSRTKDPKWSDPAQAGAKFTGLPFRVAKFRKSLIQEITNEAKVYQKLHPSDIKFRSGLILQQLSDYMLKPSQTSFCQIHVYLQNNP